MRRRTFSLGRSPIAVQVYTLLDGRLQPLSGRKHIIYYDNETRTKGHLRDGRHVELIDGKWVYKPI